MDREELTDALASSYRSALNAAEDTEEPEANRSNRSRLIQRYIELNGIPPSPAKIIGFGFYGIR